MFAISNARKTPTVVLCLRCPLTSCYGMLLRDNLPRHLAPFGSLALRDFSRTTLVPGTMYWYRIVRVRVQVLVTFVIVLRSTMEYMLHTDIPVPPFITSVIVECTTTIVLEYRFLRCPSDIRPIDTNFFLLPMPSPMSMSRQGTLPFGQLVATGCAPPSDGCWGTSNGVQEQVCDSGSPK
jgi:hypothetical protein